MDADAAESLDFFSAKDVDGSPCLVLFSAAELAADPRLAADPIYRQKYLDFAARERLLPRQA